VILTDVNVLLYAHREEVADHRRFRDWLETMIASPEAFGVTDVVLSGFLRIATHPGSSTRQHHLHGRSRSVILCATSRTPFG
jgi:predicted nucleic acid-binding protein